MDENQALAEALQLTGDSDLQTVLHAWNTATSRLEQTHEALRAEVQRLSDELEVKNRELARKNRLADLGQMAAHVAHEVRNNLVPVTLYMSLLRRRIQSDRQAAEILAKIETGFHALGATVNDLLNFTGDRDPQWSSFALKPFVDELLGSLAPQLTAQAIEATAIVAGNPPATADREMLRRALLNLLLNAVDAMPDGGKLTVAVAAGEKGIELRVADSGPGLSDDACRRAFEPFYTTKPGGTGLGLAIVYRIAEVHGGSVAAANSPEGGAVVTLHIPVRRKEVAA
jgi:signal transduction histidine kinase